jgi:hypothetical protein
MSNFKKIEPADFTVDTVPDVLRHMAYLASSHILRSWPGIRLRETLVLGS